MLHCTPMTNYDRILSEARELLTEEERRKLYLALAPEAGDVETAWLEEAHRRRAEWKAGHVEALPVAEALEHMFAKP